MIVRVAGFAACDDTADRLPLPGVIVHGTDLVPSGTEVLAGLEMGGIPVVTADRDSDGPRRPVKM